LTNCI